MPLTVYLRGHVFKLIPHFQMALLEYLKVKKTEGDNMQTLRGEEDAGIAMALPSPFVYLAKWRMLSAAQRMPTEGSDSGESKDKIDFDCGDKDPTSQRRRVCTSQRVRLNTSLHSPIPGCLDGDDNVNDGEDLDASSNGNLPLGPAERDSSHQYPHSRARGKSDRSNMRFEPDRVRESIRREYNREMGKIGPWL